MGQFNININGTSFSVARTDVSSSVSSVAISYKVTATLADSITLALTGTYVSATLTNGGSTIPYVDGTYVYSPDMEIQIVIAHASTPGGYNSVTMDVLNNTIVPPLYNQYVDTYTNTNDGVSGLVEVNDLTSAVTWANIPDANVPQSAVTQHQAALSITESQISDLQSYLLATDINTLAKLNTIVADATIVSQADIDTFAELDAIVADKALVNLADGGTFASDISVPAEAYAVGWNGSNEVPTKNDVYDEMETKMSDLLEDTTPQFGGEVDFNGHSLGGAAQTATGDGTTTIDWKLGNFFHLQMGAFSEVLTFTAPTLPGTFILRIVQDSVGSRTITWPGTVKWPGGTAPTLTTTATTGTDIITFYYDGTNYCAVASIDFQ